MTFIMFFNKIVYYLCLSYLNTNILILIIMEKPIRNDYVEMDEDSSGNLRGCLDEDAYIDALEKYIDYLELQLKNLPNELRAVNRNEQTEEYFISYQCTLCGETFHTKQQVLDHRCKQLIK